MSPRDRIREALADPIWAGAGDGEIAAYIGVSRELLAAVRAEVLLELALARVDREGVDALTELFESAIDLAMAIGRREGALSTRRRRRAA